MKRKQVVKECGVCRGSSEERLLLHSVRHRGYYRRLCTACVLNNFPGSFCPICFEVFEELPPLQQRLMCFKCPSITHSACCEESPPPPPHHYECVSCRNPNFGQIRRELINSVSAKKLLAAARIAYVVMSKSADAARADAERKVNEAALAKRNAREAMEHLVAYTQINNRGAQEDQVDDKSYISEHNKSKIEGNNFSINGSSSEIAAAPDMVTNSLQIKSANLQICKSANL